MNKTDISVTKPKVLILNVDEVITTGSFLY